jgi:SAM-dependent methyltransferase
MTIRRWDSIDLVNKSPKKPIFSVSAPPDGAQYSPAAERNREPILKVLKQVLPAQGQALEIASGTGQHVAWFAQGLPGWTWQPSDAQTDAFGSVRAWCAQAGVANVREPLVLDVLAPRWPARDPAFDGFFDAVFCANMLHIAPWATCAALMQGAARQLTPQGVLIVSGPFLERDVPTSPGNLGFDASLRQRDSVWGLRALVDVTHQAALAGLGLRQRLAMPANNLLLVFARGLDADKACS